MTGSAPRRALVLAGGASFGAFQAGVVRELAARGARWDAIYGTSVGAINGAYLAQSPPEGIVQASQDLCDFWTTVRTTDVYRITRRSLTDTVLFWKPVSKTPGLFDTAALTELVYKHISPKPLTPLRIFATPAMGGPVVVASETMEDIRPWVLASSAIPILFPPISIGEVIYQDGGVRQNNPMSYALREGSTHVDVVLCFPAVDGVTKTSSVALLSIAYKTLRAATDQFLEGEATALQAAHPESVRIWRPSRLYPTSPLDFNPKHAACLIDMGREAASALEI